MSRKQMRQIPNFRRYPRARPHRWHRVYLRTPNFGPRFTFAIHDFFAIAAPYPTDTGVSPRKGIPSSRRSARPKSSRPALVTNVMFIPWIFSTLS